MATDLTPYQAPAISGEIVDPTPAPQTFWPLRNATVLRLTGGRYRATCPRCGWQGRSGTLRIVVQIDAERHMCTIDVPREP